MTDINLVRERCELASMRGIPMFTVNEIQPLLDEIDRLETGLSVMSGHDRKGLDHLDEMMQASEERDNAERKLHNVIEWQASLQTALGLARLAMDRVGLVDSATEKAMLDLDEFRAIDSGRTSLKVEAS